MIEEHNIQPPTWLAEFVDKLTSHVYSTGGEAPLGYGWWAPRQPFNDFHGWQVAVNLLPLRIVGGAHDGGTFRAGFRLNIGPIAALFSGLSLLEWHSPARYNDPSDIPELRVEGFYEGHTLRLRMLASTPPSEQAFVELTADKDQLNVRSS